jgi:hypothetical protein
MLTLCPQCRAPSSLRQASCWVCKRVFDGSEPKIGDVPFARQATAYPERLASAIIDESAGLEQDGWGRFSRVSAGWAYSASRR